MSKQIETKVNDDKNELSLQECLEDLQKEIISGKNKTFFRTYSIETSGGKTFTTVQAIRDDYIFVKDNPFIKKHKRFIFVTKFIDEGLRVAEEINKDFDEKVALFYTPDKSIKDDNCSSNFFECAKHNVLILTHAMYMKLCNPKKKQHEDYRDIFKKYKTLIIDEEINPVKETLFSFSQANTDWINVLESFTENILAEKLYKLMNPLLNLLKQDYGLEDQLHRVECDYNRKEIETLYQELFDGISNIKNKNFDDMIASGKKEYSKSNLYDLINGIILTYNCIDDNIALIKPKRYIYAYDYTFNYLMLNNNIWLDASASFNTMYQNDLFKVVNCEREIDHINSKLIFHNMNTTTSSKNKNEDFRKNMTKYLKANYSDKKTLILTKKIECKQLAEKEEYLLNYPNFEYSNFEAMRGKNDWGEFEVCCYIHTYRLPTAYYVFLHEYFSDINLPDEELRTSTSKFVFKNSKNSKTEWGFDNEYLYNLMITDMASSMYQGIKRIARNRQPQGIFDIFTSNISVLMIVREQLKGINRKNKNLINADKGKQTNADKILDYIDDRLIDNDWVWTKVKSSEVMEELNIKSNNWTKIWNDEVFKNRVGIRKITQSQAKAGGKLGNRMVNWLIKHK
jgi:hypothetical protein